MEGELQTAIVEFRLGRKNFPKQVRNTLDAPLCNGGEMVLRDKKQVRLDHLK